MTVGRAMKSGAMIASPLAIPNCQAWYDASDASTVTLSGSNVTQWNDKSASGWNLTPGKNNPTYTTTQNGYKVISFGGATNLRKHSAAALRSVSGWAMFAAISVSSYTGNPGVFGVWTNSVGTSRAVLAITSDGYARLIARRNNADSVAFLTDNVAIDSSFCILSASGDFTNTKATLRKNGVSLASSSSWLTSGTTPNDGGAIQVSGYDDWPSAAFNGTVGELILYSAALPDAQRIAVEKYLRNKWGTA